MNSQPVEKRISGHDGHTLDVNSIFRTIQGEGPFSGRPATFIRLGGCNLRCPQCDTEYQTKSKISVTDVLAVVDDMDCTDPDHLVVITGGEPFRQNILPLVQGLIRDGHTVQIETNGTLPPPNLAFYECCSLDLSARNCCFVVCSPKTGRVNHFLSPVIAAYKYVLSAGSLSLADGLPFEVLGHSASPEVARPPEGFKGPIYVQPADVGKELLNQKNRDACAWSSLEFGYTAQLQTHKLFGVA